MDIVQVMIYLRQDAVNLLNGIQREGIKLVNVLVERHAL